MFLPLARRGARWLRAAERARQAALGIAWSSVFPTIANSPGHLLAPVCDYETEGREGFIDGRAFCIAGKHQGWAKLVLKMSFYNRVAAKPVFRSAVNSKANTKKRIWRAFATRCDNRSSRGGITLLEVLVSVGVLSVGVLGALTMLPVAKFYSAEANKYDRTAALVEEAFEESQIRGALDPANWIAEGSSGAQWAAPKGIPNPAAPDMSVVLLDPLGVAANGGNVSTVPPAACLVAGSPTIPRITLATNPTGEGPILVPMSFALTDRLFRGRDDLQFSLPKYGKRPQALPGPQPEAEGSFSFALMVRRRTIKTPAGKVIFEPINAVVDVLAFSKRDLTLFGSAMADPPPERMLYADINNPYLPSGDLNITLRGKSGWEETKRTQPILLSIQMQDQTAPNGSRVFAQWYVVAGGSGSNVVLVGPDWPPMADGWSDADSSTPQPTVYATLFDGLVLIREDLAED